MCSPSTRKLCSVTDCSRIAVSFNMCDMHYRRMRKFGTTEKPVKILPQCKYCPKPARIKGYCNKHYREVMRTDLTRPTCSITNCSKPSISRGYCITHYSRYLTKGTTDDPEVSSVQSRFWKKVNKHSSKFFNGTECWEWTASTQDGYGRFNVGRRCVLAHRYLYNITYNTFLNGSTQLHHQCQNRLCVNPMHMEEVTGNEHTIKTCILILEKNGYTITPPIVR